MLKYVYCVSVEAIVSLRRCLNYIFVIGLLIVIQKQHFIRLT
jgi:hypothetical protein